jgi:hypothetical protein
MSDDLQITLVNTIERIDGVQHDETWLAEHPEERLALRKQRLITLEIWAKLQGMVQLQTLWEMYEDGDWLLEAPVNAMGETVMDGYTYLDFISTLVDELDRRNLSSGYLMDMARIVMNVLQRIFTGDYLNGEQPWTVREVILEFPIRRIRKCSQKVSKLVGKGASEKQIKKLIKGFLDGKDDDWLDAQANGVHDDESGEVIYAFPVVEVSLRSDGCFDVSLRGLNQHQLEEFRSLISQFSPGERMV